MSARWSLMPPEPALAAALARQLKISPLLAQCLLNRGYREPETMASFLQPRLKQLADPALLPNLSAAVERLFLARHRAEPVVIFGDYDVDGVTATALLIEVLRALGWQVNYYLPHRLDEGYGLSHEGAQNCLDKCPATLLIAVDCGSTAVATVAWLQQRGVDVIVLDHHQISNPAPAAIALVNPWFADPPAGSRRRAPALPIKSPTRNGPAFHQLCSVGLVFKLAHALVKRARQAGIADAQDLDLRHFLDLVALGTIADLAPLTGENRILVKTGLERLNITPRPGLQALKSVAQVSMPLQVHAVAFQLAPRLNAAGRLEDAEAALRLLLTQNPTEAESLARELDARNRQRQAIERAIADEVIKAVGAKFNPETDYVIVEGQVRWHIGVVGIVASRVLRQFGRPTIIIGGEGDQWRGSGRSLECLDLAAALRECDELLVRHGGHALAVGLTIQPDKIDALRTRLNELARRALKPEQLQPALRLDACVSLADLTVESLTELAQLEPIGQGNPAVQFAVQRVRNQRQPQRLGQEQQHVKLWITDGAAIQEAVWWAAGAAVLPSGAFDLAFEPRINEFNGRRTVQLKLLDWRPAQATPA